MDFCGTLTPTSFAQLLGNLPMTKDHDQSITMATANGDDGAAEAKVAEEEEEAARVARGPRYFIDLSGEAVEEEVWDVCCRFFLQ